MGTRTVRLGLTVFLCLAAACAVAPAYGSVIFDSYTDTTSLYGVRFPWGFDGTPAWDSFTSPDSEQLATLSVVLWNVPEGDPASTLQFGLFQDNHTSPGALIENIVSVTADHLSGTAISDDPDEVQYKAYTFTLNSHPLVNAGTRYWIGLLDGSTGVWAYSGYSSESVGLAGEYFANPDVHPDAGFPYEMMLVGDPVTSTPEPGSASLLSLALITGFVAALQRGGPRQ